MTKRSEKETLNKQNKIEQKTLILIIYQFLKKNHTEQTIYLDALLDIMIMILLDHYV